MPDLKLFNIEGKIMEALWYSVGHSRCLLGNADTNSVDQFSAIIAQKLGGKNSQF